MNDAKMVILGAPGVGKGTQAKRIAARMGWAHISTGDMLRNAISDDSPLGNKVRAYVEKGDLVPDDVIIELVDARIDEADCESGFILDGFPRTAAQAEALSGLLEKRETVLTGVIYIDVDDEEIVGRLARRVVCEGCKDMGEGIVGAECEKCGGKLIRRKDDEPETVRHRLKVYREQTAALIDYYQEKGLLLAVQGTGTIDEVFEKVLMALKHPEQA